MQSSDKDSLLLSDVLRKVFEHEGIEFESCTFLRWRVIDDGIVPRVIQSFAEIRTEFVDGSYQLTLNGVRISRIEKEPFKVSEITVEVAHENGQWSEPRIYTGVEEFGPEHDTTQALHDRLQRIKEAFKEALTFISWIIEIAKGIQGLFR